MPLRIYIARLPFSGFPRDEVLQAARTLARAPIIFNGKRLSHPDNVVYYAGYDDNSGNVVTIVYIRDEEVNKLYEEGKSPYAIARWDENAMTRWKKLVFSALILSSKPMPSGVEMEQIDEQRMIKEISWLLK